MIKVENLTVDFYKKNIIKDISFTIGKGDFMYLLGPNGGGKSTLVKTLLGIVKKSKGKVDINTKKISYLPQDLIKSHSFPATVFEILEASFKKSWHKKGTNLYKLIDYYLKKLDIYYLKNKLLSKLSGGEFQKVVLIKAILNNPELLILDEPLSAIDVEFRKEATSLLEDLNDKGMTIIMITHDISHIGAKCKYNVMYLDREIKYYDSFCDYHKEFLKQEDHNA